MSELPPSGQQPQGGDEQKLEPTYDQLFAGAMVALEGKGVSFGQVARQTMKELIGDTPFEAVTILLGRDGFSAPSVFVVRLRSIFSGGTQSICDVIERRAAEGVRSSHDIAEVAAFEDAAHRHTESRYAEAPRRKDVFMHDHRVRDDIETYRSQIGADGASSESSSLRESKP